MTSCLFRYGEAEKYLVLGYTPPMNWNKLESKLKELEKKQKSVERKNELKIKLQGIQNEMHDLTLSDLGNYEKVEKMKILKEMETKTKKELSTLS